MDAYSIAEAKNNLPQLVHQAQREGVVQLTRRGKPVAVILSEEEYHRLCNPDAQQNSLMAAVTSWRTEAAGDEAGWSEEEVASMRDRSADGAWEWPE